MAAKGTKTGVPLYTVDAFTDEPFRGNPAAVCLLPRGMVSKNFESFLILMNRAPFPSFHSRIAFSTSITKFIFKYFTDYNFFPLTRGRRKKNNIHSAIKKTVE